MLVVSFCCWHWGNAMAMLAVCALEEAIPPIRAGWEGILRWDGVGAGEGVILSAES